MNERKVFFLIIVILICVYCLMYLIQPTEQVISIIKADEYKFAVYTSDGDILYANNLEVIRTIFNNKVLKADGFIVRNPIGIVENPPAKSITSIKKMVIESLDKSNKVLLVYIDGLGYELYEKAVKTGNIPYMASLNKGIKALTVYPPITDVAFASMVTGKTPKYTGIHNREKKPLSVDTIFDIVDQQGKKSKVIEGNIRILTSQVETILNIDLNNNGTIDDEIYESAMKELQTPPDFLIVHFHSYDDIAHVYGPNSKEALAQLQLLDSYIEDMLNTFTGDVIITSDHGMHNEGDGGKHGMFISLDMFIPIILQRCEAGDL